MDFVLNAVYFIVSSAIVIFSIRAGLHTKSLGLFTGCLTFGVVVAWTWPFLLIVLFIFATVHVVLDYFLVVFTR